jgi:hypothetical protein
MYRCCRRAPWSKDRPHSPLLARRAIAGATAAPKSRSACSKACCQFRRNCTPLTAPGRGGTATSQAPHVRLEHGTQTLPALLVHVSPGVRFLGLIDARIALALHRPGAAGGGALQPPAHRHRDGDSLLPWRARASLGRRADACPWAAHPRPGSRCVRRPHAFVPPPGAWPCWPGARGPRLPLASPSGERVQQTRPCDAATRTTASGSGSGPPPPAPGVATPTPGPPGRPPASRTRMTACSGGAG